MQYVKFILFNFFINSKANTDALRITFLKFLVDVRAILNQNSCYLDMTSSAGEQQRCGRNAPGISTDMIYIGPVFDHQSHKG